MLFIVTTEPENRGFCNPRLLYKGVQCMIVNLREIGRRCKEFRIELGYYQSDVANDTGYSIENISSFETGRNDNAKILLWYIAHGMSSDRIFNRGVSYGKSI